MDEGHPPEEEERQLPILAPEAKVLPDRPSGYRGGPVPPGARGPGSPPAPPAAPPEPGIGGHLLATWWMRVWATVIDLGLILALAAIIVGLFSLVFFSGTIEGAVSLVVGILVAFVAVVFAVLVYPATAMSILHGQTVGKRVCRIRVVRTNGLPMDIGWSMLREAVIKWILFVFLLSPPTGGIAWIVDVLWPLWDDERRALHDILAGTRVVKA
jgi:uncharacterized RDD family membrane protein YckC